MARRELARAVVVLDHLRSDGRTLSRRAGAADELLGSAGGHRAQGSDAQCREAQKAIESRWVSGGRGRHRQGAGQAGSVEADDESYSDGLERYVRAACVSLSRSESSHENAHLRLLRIAW